MDDIVIQFSIYSEKSSSTEVHDAMTDLKAMFDDCRLTVSGGTVVSFFRLNDGLELEEIPTSSGVHKVWHYHTDYRVYFERT
jgi:hypothetical protein